MYVVHFSIRLSSLFLEVLYMGLFLDFLFCPIGLCVSLLLQHCFNCWGFIKYALISVRAIFSFFRIFLVIIACLFFNKVFRMSLSSSWKKNKLVLLGLCKLCYLKKNWYLYACLVCLSKNTITAFLHSILFSFLKVFQVFFISCTFLLKWKMYRYCFIALENEVL